MKRFLALLACALWAMSLSDCSAPPPAGPPTITAMSTTFDVKGVLFPLSISQVDGVRVENGKVAIRGGDETVTVDVPAGADPAKPNTHWALTTESELGNNRKRITFTHDESVEDFSVDVPASEAMPHYGVLSGPNDADVLILAWGEKSRCYWGYVTIAKKAQ